MYASNTRAPEFIKETVLQLKLHLDPDNDRGDFNIKVLTNIQVIQIKPNFQRNADAKSNKSN